jgi:hypothetical protein
VYAATIPCRREDIGVTAARCQLGDLAIHDGFDELCIGRITDAIHRGIHAARACQQAPPHDIYKVLCNDWEQQNGGSRPETHQYFMTLAKLVPHRPGQLLSLEIVARSTRSSDYFYP